MEHQAGILRSLLEQLQRQEAVEKEAPNGIPGEFARLKNQSTKYRTEKTYPTKTAEKTDNIKKNRYKDILPFDHSRVKLTFTTSKNDTDYINASFIKGVSGSRAYIATQGPLPHTVLDFLRMIWEYNIQIVVMACREFEMGKKKCERYWPETQEQPFSCEPFTVYCDSEEGKGDYLTRVLRLNYRNSTRTLKQLHYVNWPDHGVPDSIPPILDMLHEMRTEQDNDDVPICIHCSAGCGRTGALCVIDYTWNLLKKQMITPDFSIYDLVQNMRTQRPSLVQTKEQYELVYRTIKLLFEQYLESMNAQAHQREVIMVPSTIMQDAESSLFNLSEDFDYQPQFQHLLDEERDALALYLQSSSSASENPISLRTNETQEWDLLQFLPEALSNTQDLQEVPRTSPKLASQRSSAAVEGKNILPQNPSPVTETICHMVEDPYFETPVSSPTSEEEPVKPELNGKQWGAGPIFNAPSLSLNDQTLELNPPASGTEEIITDDEAAPPLPQRTPESYVMAVDTEHPDPCERLMVIIPANAAAEAVRELGGPPSSPVPPLPERTPESFELAEDQAPVVHTLDINPAGNLSRIGSSSEWSGDSLLATAASENETKTWARSKSLRVKMTFTAAAPTSLAFSTTNLPTTCPPLGPKPPHLLRPTEESLNPPLPNRTPESFILSTPEVQKKTPHSSPRVGRSSEWDGTSQPKRFLDTVMSRSKSVRAKSSKSEPLTVHQLTPPPVVRAAAAGSAAQPEHHDAQRRSSLNPEASGNKSDKSNEKGMSRSRSLRFFKQKSKAKTAPPPPPAQAGTPPPSYAATSLFKFGFGTRFGKPKGPRSYPETWV